MRQLSISRRRFVLFAFTLFLACAFALLFFNGQSYAKKNKALKAGFFFTGVKMADLGKDTTGEKLTEAMKDNAYTFGTEFKKKIAFSKNMKVSGKFYIPKKLLDKDGSMITVLPILGFMKNNDKNEYDIQGKYALLLQNKKGKITSNLYDKNNKSIKKGKMVSVTTKKNFYIVQYKNFPLSDKVANNTAIPASGEYKSAIMFSFISLGKNYSGFFYLDDVSLKAKTTTKVTFDKKDYKSIFAFETMNYKHRIPVETAPVK